MQYKLFDLPETGDFFTRILAYLTILENNNLPREARKNILIESFQLAADFVGRDPKADYYIPRLRVLTQNCIDPRSCRVETTGERVLEYLETRKEKQRQLILPYA